MITTIQARTRARAHEETSELLTVTSCASKRHRYSGWIQSVFKDLTLSMQRSTCLALMGPNGCGKSSLLQVLLGLQTLDEGEVGLNLSRHDLLGAVLQDYRSQLLPWASVEENLFLALEGELQIGFDKDQILSAAQDFFDQLHYDIPLKKLVKYLSGGQQQSVVLSRALAFQPDFFIWDEPMSAIDSARCVILYQYLQRYWRKAGSSVVIVTHDLDEALLLADQIVIFDEKMNIRYEESIEVLDAIRTPSFLDTDVAKRIRMNIYKTVTDNGWANAEISA